MRAKIIKTKQGIDYDYIVVSDNGDTLLTADQVRKVELMFDKLPDYTYLHRTHVATLVMHSICGLPIRWAVCTWKLPVPHFDLSKQYNNIAIDIKNIKMKPKERRLFIDIKPDDWLPALVINNHKIQS